MVANFEQEKETYRQMKDREEREREQIVKTMLLELTGKEYTDTCAKCGIQIIVTRGEDLGNKMYNHKLNMRNPETHEVKYSGLDFDTGYKVGLEDIKVCMMCSIRNCDKEKQEEKDYIKSKMIKLSKPLNKYIKKVFQCPICKEVQNSLDESKEHLSNHEIKEIKQKLNNLGIKNYRDYELYSLD